MGYNILQYEKQEIKKTDISEFCKEKMRQIQEKVGKKMIRIKWAKLKKKKNFGIMI